MKTSTIEICFAEQGLRSRIDQYFANIGQGINAHHLYRARAAQIAKLDAKTDLELARMGLRRDGIIPFVFSDLLTNH